MRRVVVGLAIAIATLTPTWALANDQQIAQQIIQKLEQQKQAGQLKGFGIDLQVDDGTVFMNGKVVSAEQQQIALGIAQREPGVKQVVNGLQIEGAEVAQPAKAASGWGGAVKKAFGRSEAPTPEVQQVANNEPITYGKSIVVKPSAKKSAPAPTATQARFQQSELVAAQQPAYQTMAPPVAQPRMMQSQMQPQMQGAPMGQYAMPGHTGPSRQQQMPMPYRQVAYNGQPMAMAPSAYGQPAPIPAQMMGGGMGAAPARYDQPNMPGYAWPSYASHPNYAAVTYPKQYSPTAWPYIGPFYPYPQVPLGWRKVTLEWDDGWWMLDFKDQNRAWKTHQ